MARKAPARAILFCGIDANARFGGAAPSPSPATAEGRNGQLLCEFMANQRLTSTALVDSEGHNVCTWTSPNGKDSCIDYLLFPAEMSSNIRTVGAIQGFADTHPKDHKPLLADVCWTLRSSTQAPRFRLDTARMRTVEGRATLAAIHEATPSVPWYTDVDSHALILTRHLQHQLAHFFPVQAATPRQYTISDETWAAIRLKRHAKRVGHRIQMQLRRETLMEVWLTWRGVSSPKSAMRQRRLRMLSAQCCHHVVQANATYRQLSRRDCAQRARQLFFEAKGKGPEAMAQHLRSLTRSGRRFKPLPTQPCIHDQDGKAVDDPFLALGQHFAKDEHGHLCTDLSELATTSQPRAFDQGDPFPREDVISMPKLTVAFASLANHKAAGLTGVPPEAFSQSAAQAASKYWPLYLKATLRKQCPTLWRGGRAVPIGKPQKPIGTLAAWRSILLIESAAKGIASAARDSLLAGFEKILQPGQGGSRRGAPLQLPMIYAQSTLDFLIRKGISGGLIFIDGKAAFYATFREIVLGQDALLTPQQIERLVQLISPDETIQEAILTAAFAPGLLASADVSPALRDYLASSLHRTWFLIGNQAIFRTHAGSMPGAPLADLVFQFAFGHFMERAYERIHQLDLDLMVSANHPQYDDVKYKVPAGSWMDDIVYPISSSSAAQLIPRAQQLLKVVAEELACIGIRVNVEKGKSEALLHFCGPSSKKVRHHWLTENNAVFPVELPGQQIGHMHIVASYVHLGSLVSFDRSPVPDIRRRAGLARETRRKIHRPLLTNVFLSPQERLTMHWSLVVRKFLHGAGLWVFRLDRDQVTFTAAYMSLIRPICMPVLGIPAKGLEDSLVCAICGFPDPGLLRDLELISLVPAVSKMTCQALHAMLHDSNWLREVTAAWNRLCTSQHQLSCQELLDSLQRDLSSAIATLRATRRRIRLQLRAKQDEARTQAKARHAACFTGWIFIPLDSLPSTFTHQCNICGHRCATASGLAVHKLHRHGQSADAGITGSATLCPSCGIEFWEPYRLRDHLRKHPNCLLPIIESDVDFEGQSRTSHQQLAWRPAVKVPFVQPWWATLHPVRTEVQSTVFQEHSVSICNALDALDLALKKRHSPKSALEALFERVREAKSCTECALSEFVSPDHPLFSFAELAVWLARCPGGPSRFDGIGFRAAVDSGNVMIRLAGAARHDSTDPIQHALMRSLL